MTSRLAQWNPCGLQGRSVGISQARALDFHDFLFSVVYFVFPVAIYLTVASKEAVHEADDGTLVLAVTAVLLFDLQRSWQWARALCNHRLTQWSPCGLQGWSVGCHRMCAVLYPLRRLSPQRWEGSGVCGRVGRDRLHLCRVVHRGSS